MALLAFWMYLHYGVNGLGVAGFIYLGQLYILDRTLARREGKRFDAMPDFPIPIPLK